LEPGGQLTTTTDVDNFPGYPNGVDGPTMMNELKEQAERFGTKVKIDFISKVDFSREKGGIHKLYTQNGDEIKSKTVIISTGASAKYLGLESEQRLIGGGVSACAVCDGFFYKNQDVAIVGGGDTAIEEATYLAKICRNVTMLVRKDHFRASKAMQNRLANFDNITVLFNHEINEVIGESVVEGIEIKNNLNDEVSDIKITGLFIAIGHSPNTDIFKGTVNMDDSGYILTDKISTKTNIPGVFAAGDVQDKDYRQAITAAGTGCMAALDAERYLQEV
jgi:thioredoxin reductase (NADPH)